MDVLIVEDYPQVAKRVARLTRDILDQTLTSLKCVNHYREAEAYLERYPVDLLLLDLNLGGDDGFNLLKKAVARSFQTIVISASGERALEAFEYGVLDFVSKPFNKERLEKAFSRLSGTSHEGPPLSYLAIKDGQRIQLLNIQDVIFIKGAGNYSELHLKDGRIALHEKNMDRLTLLLTPHFERIHKSYLAHLSHATSLQSHGGGRYSLEMKNGEALPVGRTRYKALRERMG